LLPPRIALSVCNSARESHAAACSQLPHPHAAGCRNSKLTFLLQDALAPDCRTIIYINVSPRRSDAQETLSCLTFAHRLQR
jgi:hypothetical protein